MTWKDVKQESDFGDYYLENTNPFSQTDGCSCWTTQVNRILYLTLSHICNFEVCEHQPWKGIRLDYASSYFSSRYTCLS